jgi:hypothetical protein
VASYEVDLGGPRAKVREPGLVLLWHVLTLGIYNFFWYYKINRELRDYGESMGDAQLAGSNPVLSLLAVTLGWLLIVPPFVSWWRCTGRIRAVQRKVDVELTTGWLIAVCYVFAGIFWLAIPIYVQDGLNNVWKRYPAVEPAPDAASPERRDAAVQAQAPAEPGEVKLSDIARED